MMADKTIVNGNDDLLAEELTYSYGKKFTLGPLNMSLAPHKRYAFVGFNGAGKTTLLHLISGHLTPTKGTLRLGGQSLSTLPARKRPITTVFQDLALFPSMTVEQNIAFGIKHLAGLKRRDLESRCNQYVDLLHLQGLQNRRIHRLSRGEAQRVAIARAIAPQPRLLLLDEPSSSLDPYHKSELLILLRGLVSQSWNGCMVCVTHDIDFALAFADHITILDQGKVIGSGDVPGIFTRPPNLKTATFISSIPRRHNLVEGTIDSTGHFSADNGAIRGMFQAPNRCITCSKATLFLRPDLIRICSNGSTEGAIHFRIEDLLFQGSLVRLLLKELRDSAHAMQVCVDLPASQCGVEHAVGATVAVDLNIREANIFHDENEVERLT